MKPQRSSQVRKTLLGIVALILLVGIVAIWPWSSAQPDFATPPEPNAYELLLTASRSFVWETNAPDGFFVRNAAVFDAVSDALRHESEAPPRYYDASAVSTMSTMSDVASLKRLSVALLRKAAVAEQEQRWADAVATCLQLIKLGQKVERGPVIHLLSGLGMETAALKRLESLAPKLTAEQSAETASSLRQANEERISWEDAMRRERYYVEVNYGIFRRLWSSVTRSSAKVDAKVRQNYLSVVARMDAQAAEMEAR